MVLLYQSVLGGLLIGSKGEITSSVEVYLKVKLFLNSNFLFISVFLHYINDW